MGGGVAGQFLGSMLGGGMAGEIGAAAGDGGILMIIIGLIKGMMAK